ncbi:MAG: hypothetical protein KGN30_00650 [Nitrospirota bacterium]|nr:hypothetical protein [Nitrospirota bacterium]
MTSAMRTRVWGMVLAVGMVATLAGCDYWPPALQAQIEQLKAEVQAAAAERANLDNQLKDAVKAKEELQARLDELARLNRELAGNIANLKQALDAEREKTAKLGKSASKAAPKAAAKPAPAPGKKKPAAKAPAKSKKKV